MADIVDIFDKMKTVVEMREHATTLFQGLKRATELLQEKDSEIAHLKELLSRSVPLIGDASTVRVVKSTEEVIMETEIEKLRVVSQQRPLNLNETKQLDVYIKGLRIVRGESPIEAESKPKQKVTEAELIQLALDSNE